MYACAGVSTCASPASAARARNENRTTTIAATYVYERINSDGSSLAWKLRMGLCTREVRTVHRGFLPREQFRERGRSGGGLAGTGTMLAKRGPSLTLPVRGIAHGEGTQFRTFYAKADVLT